MNGSRICLMLAAMSVTACHSFLIEDDPLDSPENNFQILWDEFDRWYAGFLVRNVDWDALYASYRPRVTSQTTDPELWDIVTAMLTHLRDLHTSLDDPRAGRFFNAANPTGAPDPRDFDRELVRTAYLIGAARQGGQGRLFYGQLSDRIGYLHIADFEGRESSSKPPVWADDIDQVVSQFANLDGMVIDVRQNHGGSDPTSHRIAGAFADQRRFVYTVQTRNGPGHDDFDEPRRWYVEPAGPSQFTKPIVLITDRASSSAAEIFSLLMTSLPHVTHVGDSTGGGFSDVSFDRFLPNGWVYRMSHQLYRTADGGSPEGIGVVPDIVIKNTEAEIAAGTDRVLEFAIGLLP